MSDILPWHVFCANVPVIVSSDVKSVTVNTWVSSGSVAMAFNSCSLAPDPTPIEKTVTPASLSLAASDVVSEILLDLPEIIIHFQNDLVALQIFRRL